jgi:hypothetical protein
VAVTWATTDTRINRTKEIPVMMAAKIKDYHKGAEIASGMIVATIFRINAEDTKIEKKPQSEFSIFCTKKKH